jgi:hypothetical protein
MGGKLILIALLLFVSCTGRTTLDWGEILKVENNKSIVFILIPLENSCNSCQIYLGDWLLKNPKEIDRKNVHLILVGKDKFILDSYADQFSASKIQIDYDLELKFINSKYLEGEYPYYKIKLIEFREGKLVQEFSLQPGNQKQIMAQAQKFILKF